MRITDCKNLSDDLTRDVKYNDLRIEFFSRIGNRGFRDVCEYARQERDQLRYLNYQLVQVYDQYVVENRCKDKFALMFYDDSIHKAPPQKVFAYTVMANIGLVLRYGKVSYREASLKTVMKSDWNLFDRVLYVLECWYKRCESDMYQAMPMDCDDLFV